MRTRGQAALEFLTTYGWAILIILVMIGTISYFGVLNPSKLLPSKCTVGSELTCVDYRIDSTAGQVSLILQQDVGQTIYLQRITCSYGNDTSAPVDLKGAAWSPKDQMPIDCFSPAKGNKYFAGLSGQKVKVLFDVVYKNSQAGFDHLVSGEVYTGVQ